MHPVLEEVIVGELQRVREALEDARQEVATLTAELALTALARPMRGWV